MLVADYSVSDHKLFSVSQRASDQSVCIVMLMITDVIHMVVLLIALGSFVALVVMVVPSLALRVIERQNLKDMNEAIRLHQMSKELQFEQ